MMEDDRAHQFLICLDDDLYSNIRGHIFSLKLVSRLDKIFNMVQEEGYHKWTIEIRKIEMITADKYILEEGTLYTLR